MTARNKILSIAILIVFIPGAAVWGLVFTQTGSRILVGVALRRVPDFPSGPLEDMEGSLAQQLVFKDVELKDLKHLPAGSVLRIQRLKMRLRSFSVKDAQIWIENARLNLPQSEPILIQGTYRNQELDLTVYSRTLVAAEIVGIFPQSHSLRSLSGTVNNADLHIQGDLQRLRVEGTAMIQELIYRDFCLRDAPLDMVLTVASSWNGSTPAVESLAGSLDFDRGTFEARKTQIGFEPSRIVFSGDPQRPDFSLAGHAQVNAVRIQGSFRGTLDDPQIHLTSQPPLPSDLLLVMLATGKSWKGVRTAMEAESISPELVTDFLDYFFFDGRGEKMARAFGIKDISVTLEQNKKGVGISKGVGDKMEVFYGVTELTPAAEGNSSILDQKIGGKLKFSEAVSVSAEREMKGAATTEQVTTATEPVSNDKVIMEYNRKF